MGIPLVNDHLASWNIPMFNSKYIFNLGPFSIVIAMLVYQGVLFAVVLNFQHYWKRWLCSSAFEKLFFLSNRNNKKYSYSKILCIYSPAFLGKINFF